MSDEKSQQQTSTESTVAGAAKTGKAISNIAKGAAAGGAHGAAIEAGKSSAKWLIPLIAAVLLPLILVAMLPSIIFGSLLGDGTDTPNGISSDEVLVQNMTAINESISFILSEGLTDVLERIDSDFASSGCDGKEINNPFGADVVFNANAFVSQYCAHKDTDVASISKEDTGWHTVRYDDLVDGKYLYNRCHLIGFQLTGENANTKNLITGTRYLNIEGMLPFENMVADYVKENGNHVMYRVTPIFEGDNLLANGVLMEGYSVEDKGAGVSYCVFAYNVQPGIEIDYATGESKLADSAQQEEQKTATVTPTPSPEPEKQEPATGSEASQADYILNTNTKKFHYPTCSSVNDMKEKNKQEFFGTRDEAISNGYSPCGHCKP